MHASGLHSSPHRAAHSAKLAGSLRGDLAEIALKLHDALHRSDIKVWTNAHADIYFEAVDRSPDVGAEWLAGIYGVGAAADDIEADLLVLRRERVPAAMLD